MDYVESKTIVINYGGKKNAIINIFLVFQALKLL